MGMQFLSSAKQTLSSYPHFTEGRYRQGSIWSKYNKQMIRVIYNPGTNPQLTGRIAASVFCSLRGRRQKHNAACYPPRQTVIEQQNPLPLRSTLLFSRVFGQPGLVELDRLTHTFLVVAEMIKQGGLFRP